MNFLKTVKKSDPDFDKYILGTFSSTERAIPLESLNINSDLEQITFRIVPIKEIQKPFFLVWWAQLFKVHHFILILFPIFVISVKNISYNNLNDFGSAFMAILATICLQAAAHLRNDYIDHVSGVDRIHPQAGSRAIQNGWITAFQVRRLSWVYLILGALFAIPVILEYWRSLLPLLGFALFVFVGIFNFKFAFKFRQWTEVAVFFLFGPLFAIGFQISSGASYDIETLFIGVLMGWFAVFTVHVKNFEQMMVNSQAGYENSVSILGFEKAKTLIRLWWLAFLVMFNVYHMVYSAVFWSWVMILATVIGSFSFIGLLNSLESPVGSVMQKLNRQVRLLFVFILSLWFLENVWMLWTATA